MSLFLVKTRPVQRLYDRVSEASAALVISSYSSSFGLASRLLAGPVRGRDASPVRGARRAPRHAAAAQRHRRLRHDRQPGFATGRPRLAGTGPVERGRHSPHAGTARGVPRGPPPRQFVDPLR